MQAHRPGRPSSSPTVATRVQTPCAPPGAFAWRLPMAAPAAPRTARSPTPFRAPCPPARPLSMGRGHRSAPRAPSPPLPQRKAADGALPFSPFATPIYIYARARGLFVPSVGGVRCALRRENGKAVENAWGGGHFLHRVEKPVENKLWISGKSARFFHCPATNGCEAVDAPRAEGVKTRKRCAKHREVLHEEAKANHRAREALPLPTEKPAHRHENSA